MIEIDDSFTEAAPAKINLTLHVTGQRDDGYHLLDSIVAFTALGDLVRVESAKETTLTIEGAFAHGLSTGDDNLVMRAARAFKTNKQARITLRKDLPVASGIGGGSSDCAATLRALSRRWNLSLPDAETILRLGADVPVCMTHELTRMRGIGDEIERLCPLPRMDLVLVNPRIAVSTAQVFQRLESKTNPPPDSNMPDPSNWDAWITWLRNQRNDLEPPARAAYPVITDVIDALYAQDDCLLARMSGSGATCFGLFNDHDSAVTAAKQVQALHPDWWVRQTCEHISI